MQINSQISLSSGLSLTRRLDFFQHLAIYINENVAQWDTKFAKVGPKIPQIVNKPSKNYPRL